MQCGEITSCVCADAGIPNARARPKSATLSCPVCVSHGGVSAGGGVVGLCVCLVVVDILMQSHLCVHEKFTHACIYTHDPETHAPNTLIHIKYASMHPHTRIVYEQVFRFQISVQDAVAVAVREGIDQLVQIGLECTHV